MNGYYKMRNANKKTRSMDFIDLLSSPPTQETKANTCPKSPEREDSGAEEVAVVKSKNRSRDSPPKVEEKVEEDANPGSAAAGAVKLMRTCSVAAISSPSRFRLERQTSRRTPISSGGRIQSAVKRVLSIRRSSSVSERYCRIYDQHVTLDQPAFDDEHDGDGDGDAGATDNNAVKIRSIRTKKKNGILKTCRRLFGF